MEQVEKTLKDLEFLKDIEILAKVELASLEKTFEFVLNLKEGDILNLEKNIEDFVILYFFDEKVGFGEIVNINDKYGFRLVDLIR